MHGPGVRNLHSEDLLFPGYIPFSVRYFDINGVCVMIVSLWSKTCGRYLVSLSVVVHDIPFEGA